MLLNEPLSYTKDLFYKNMQKNYFKLIFLHKLIFL